MRITSPLVLATGLTTFLAISAAAQTPPTPAEPAQPAPTQPAPTPTPADPSQPTPQPTPTPAEPSQPTPPPTPTPQPTDPSQPTPPPTPPQPTPTDPQPTPTPQPQPTQETPPPTPPAQMPPPQTAAPAPRATPRWTISANGGFQFISQGFETSTEFDAFEERATLSSAGELKSEPIFDAGVTYALNESYGVGVATSLYVTENNVAVLARVPHPIFFDQVRIANYDAAGVQHTSLALHLNGVWFIPFTTTLDFAVSAGPSIVFVKQDVVTAANLQSENPPFSTPSIDSVTLTQQRKTTIGFNVGADATYSFGERYGVGATARYLFASADVEGLTDSIQVGGFQILAGLRIKF